MDIVVTPVDLADPFAAERAYEIHLASRAVDVPDLPPFCRQRFFGTMRHPMPGRQHHYALAHLDGVPVGYLGLNLPQLANTENAAIDLMVHPECRRRGVGRALHAYAVRLLREQGRKRMVSLVVAELPGGPSRSSAGAGFAAALGAQLAQADVRRRLDITTLDQPGLDRLLADAWPRAAGYSLLCWTGAAPAEYLDDVAYLEGRLIEDAPSGELVREPEKMDAAQVRAIEATFDAWGRRLYHCGIRHDATGRLVAWTMLDFAAANPWHAFQQITVVGPGHRGHRLGTIIKIENLRYALAHEPALRAVDTWNAQANAHMISINEAIGLRPVDAWHNWQLTI